MLQVSGRVCIIKYGANYEMIEPGISEGHFRQIERCAIEEIVGCDGPVILVCREGWKNYRVKKKMKR